MKKSLLFLLASALLLAGCSVAEPDGVLDDDSPVFKTIDSQPSTRTYIDENMVQRWNGSDAISIFRSTINEKYNFLGRDGSKSGIFVRSLLNPLRIGRGIPRNYAVYPYSEENRYLGDDVIQVDLPAVQPYAENSFAPGSSTMIATTSCRLDYLLPFKNVCGWLVVRLYGDATVKSVSLCGNAGEQIAGEALITGKYGADPTVQMNGDEDNTTITVDCGDGVTLGQTAEEATDFWFCIPPVTFSEGYTVTVTDTDNQTMTKSTTTSRSIERNIKVATTPLRFNAGSEPQKKPQSLSFDYPTVEWILGDPYKIGGFSKPQMVTGAETAVIYFSDNEDVAKIIGNEIFILSEGETTITALAVESEEFLAGSESYKLTISRVDALFFTALSDVPATISFNLLEGYQLNTLEYSTDRIEWNVLSDSSVTDAVVEVATLSKKGDKLFIRAKTKRVKKQNADSQVKFVTSGGPLKVSGNVMYLVDPEGGADYEMNPYEFINLFQGCTNIEDASCLDLHTTKTSANCYAGMFSGCTSLVSAPALPATTMSDFCYMNMFSGCLNLAMAPTLSATTLGISCYANMFSGCTSLVSAPALPATTLCDSCYSGMFSGCTSLKKAPELKAPKLTDKCYLQMFNGCTELNSITCLATDISADACTSGWVSGVTTSVGTFKIASSLMEMLWDEKGEGSGKPTNFTYAYAINL